MRRRRHAPPGNLPALRFLLLVASLAEAHEKKAIDDMPLHLAASWLL